MKEGVYGPAVCSKRNYDPSIRIFRQQTSTSNGRQVKVDNNMVSAEQQHFDQPTVTPTPALPGSGKSNGHHVVIIGDEKGGGSGVAGGDDDDSKRFNS